jgi:hemerythrin superfamily protein
LHVFGSGQIATFGAPASRKDFGHGNHRPSSVFRNTCHQLLTADHREVDGLFAEYEKAEQANRKVALVNDILRALTVHAEIEERIFYPATRAVLEKDGQDMVDEAYVEHASLKGLILQLNGQSASSPLFKGYVTTLKEYVQHHVKEEEKEYFPKVEKTDLDLEALGTEMKGLKDTLMSKLNSAPRQAGAVRFA